MLHPRENTTAEWDTSVTEFDTSKGIPAFMSTQSLNHIRCAQTKIQDLRGKNRHELPGICVAGRRRQAPPVTRPEVDATFVPQQKGYMALKRVADFALAAVLLILTLPVTL